MMKPDLRAIETQLHHRLAYPYRWYGKQNDALDQATNFIYRITDFDELLDHIQHTFQGDDTYTQLFNYALNRWYNFWSARAVEEIFCGLDRVHPARNSRDRLVDFQIDAITFDHKTSVFPQRYDHSLPYAQSHPQHLISWLYTNQSQEQRKHLRNRLFIVLYASQGDHWKLKAEIIWLQQLIQRYVQNFDPQHLHQFVFEQDAPTLADIIWGVA